MRTTPRVMAAVAGAILIAVIGAAVALAAKVENGSFEDRLHGWKHDSKGEGRWSARHSGPGELGTAPVGDLAAFASQSGPSSNVLYQDVTLRRHLRHTLNFRVAYQNTATQFATPDSLKTGPLTPPVRSRGVAPAFENQQFRVDVMKPSAPLRSVQGQDVLKRVFRTDVGDPLTLDWFRVRAGLSKFAGRTVRLRFAEVDNLSNFYVGIDAVRIKTTSR
jgi:hypothetical protein